MSSGLGRSLGAAAALPIFLSLVMLGPESHGQTPPPPPTWAWESPKAKINHIDVSKAPEIKLFVSYLDRRLKPVDHEAFVRTFTVFKKPKKGNAKELFSFLKSELVISDKKKEGEEEPDEDTPAPQLTLAAEEKDGGSIMVIVPGTSAIAYKEGLLGGAQKTAIGLVFKAGSNAKINLLWVTDQVLTFVEGDNRATLSPIERAREKCEKWKLRVLRGDIPKPEKEGEEPPKDKDQVNCGLLGAEAAALVPKIAEETTYSGFWPHMFGLRGIPCGKPKFERGQGVFKSAETTTEFPETLSALDIALETLIREGPPGKPRIIVIIGDGKDGYIKGREDCTSKAQTYCSERFTTNRPNRRKMKRQGLKRKERNQRVREWRANRRACINGELKKSAKYAQERFKKRLPTWLALAKAGNIRIHTLANRLARPHEAQRLEVLALKTGGTYRYAATSAALIEMATELADEIATQYVFTFTDTEATPDTDHGYLVQMAYETRNASGKTKTPVRRVHVPAVAEGFGIWVTKMQAGAEKKLGKAGVIAILIIVGLLLALILLKIFKKIFGKGAKAAKGKGKGAAKAAKGAGKAAKKAKGAGKMLRKIKK